MFDVLQLCECKRRFDLVQREAFIVFKQDAADTPDITGVTPTQLCGTEKRDHSCKLSRYCSASSYTSKEVRFSNNGTVCTVWSLKAAVCKLVGEIVEKMHSIYGILSRFNGDFSKSYYNLSHSVTVCYILRNQGLDQL